MASRPQLNQSEVGRLDAGGVVRLGRWLYDYLLSLGHNPVSAPRAGVVGASPFTYTNTSTFAEDVIFTGGTVSGYSFARDGTSIPVGNAVRLLPGDSVTVTYSGLPTMTIIPG